MHIYRCRYIYIYMYILYFYLLDTHRRGVGLLRNEADGSEVKHRFRIHYIYIHAYIYIVVYVVLYMLLSMCICI